MNVLVTGGAGVIGSHVTEDLLARGDAVLIIDNFETGRRDSVPESPRLTLVEDTITNPERVIEVFETFRPEVVVHCAASYKDGEAWEDDVSTNVLGTINVVRACQRAGCRRLIYLQTALCYGLSPSKQPVPIDYPLAPAGSSYAYSKTVAEQYIQLSGIEYVTFRLANVYGPRTLTGPMPVFYDRLVRGKPCFVVDTRRDWVFVKDLAKLVLLAIDGMGERGAYHGASGTDYAIKDLYEATRAALGLPPDPHLEIRPRGPTDAYTLLLDPSKTQRDFGWKATTPFEDGIRHLVDWYRTHAPEQFYTHLKLDEADSQLSGRTGDRTSPRPTLYEAVGGSTGVLRLASAWHERVLKDEVVAHAFSHGFHPQHTERLAAYWGEAWGGPPSFTENYGSESSVVRIHSGNGPHGDMDRRAIACFDVAMADVGVHDAELRRVLHDYFAWATTTSMAAYERSAEDVPDDLRMPRWSWDGLQD